MVHTGDTTVKNHCLWPHETTIYCERDKKQTIPQIDPELQNVINALDKKEREALRMYTEGSPIQIEGTGGSVKEILHEEKTLKWDLKDENELVKSRMKDRVFQIHGLLQAQASVWGRD